MVKQISSNTAKKNGVTPTKAIAKNGKASVKKVQKVKKSSVAELI